MKHIALAAACLCVLHTSPALAESTVMTDPMQAGRLHEGPLDMVAYWTSADGRAYEVTAVFRARTATAEPMRIAMQMLDGDDVSFGLPGQPGVLYRFVRRDGVVSASVRTLSEVSLGG